MATASIPEVRTCRKCGATKSITDFHRHAGQGRSDRRAQCRTCYNSARRARHATPEYREEHNRKRREHESRPEAREQRRAYRERPEVKAKAREAKLRWLSKPGVRERQAAKWKARRCLPDARALTLLNASQKRAEKRGLPFDLTLEWLSAKIAAGHCEATGLEFDFGPPPGGWNYNPKGPSVDQITAGGGYLMSNCRVVLVAFNNAVGQYGDDLYAEVATAFLRRRGIRIE